ncbi:MAG: SDR family oxidoreductase [Spirochaetes bacterium]|nr:SDR family oxidoreductase [Spirochaetota bacterium]
MKNSYKGKRAFITGGASGIGRALCQGLASRGASVVVSDINLKEAGRVAAAINEAGGTACAVKLDVTDESSVFRAVENTAAESGGLDYYFNNAGIGISADALDLTMAQWRKIFDVNLFGVLYGTMAAYGVMARQGYGHIVNVSSMAGFAPFSINTPYTAAKYGVVGLTEALRHEAAGLGVGMTLVCPGIVRSSFYDAIEIIGTDREAYISWMPKRLIDPERAAAVILDGVAQNRKTIIFPFHAKLLWWTKKLAPGLLDFMNRTMVKKFRSLRTDD